MYKLSVKIIPLKNNSKLPQKTHTNLLHISTEQLCWMLWTVAFCPAMITRSWARENYHAVFPLTLFAASKLYCDTLHRNTAAPTYIWYFVGNYARLYIWLYQFVTTIILHVCCGGHLFTMCLHTKLSPSTISAIKPSKFPQTKVCNKNIALKPKPMPHRFCFISIRDLRTQNLAHIIARWTFSRIRKIAHANRKPENLLST